MRRPRRGISLPFAASFWPGTAACAVPALEGVSPSLVEAAKEVFGCALPWRACANSRCLHKAVYVDELAKHFARAFAKAIDKDRKLLLDDPKVEGVESVVCNDLLESGSWSIVLEWHWKRFSHINILEAHSFLTLRRFLASEGEEGRFNALTLALQRVPPC